jgi:dUTP pyrophosphatase
MKKIALFEKVSLTQYINDMKKNFDFGEEQLKQYYENILLPKRATMGSAGYDFKIPFAITIKPNETKKIPTGIRVKMSDGWVLLLFPRSSLGFKYRMQLDNTVGVIDSDYYNSDNEGHIILKVSNDTKENKVLELEANKGICQGIFLEFGISIDDDTTEDRNGGFGSTN